MNKLLTTMFALAVACVTVSAQAQKVTGSAENGAKKTARKAAKKAAKNVPAPGAAEPAAVRSKLDQTPKAPPPSAAE